MELPKLNLKKMTKKDDDNTNLVIENNESNPVSDELSLMAISELLNEKKLKTISRIKPDQVSNLVKLYAFSDTFKTRFSSHLADYILQLQISLNGYGRQELVQLVQQRNNNIMLEKPMTSKDIFK